MNESTDYKRGWFDGYQAARQNNPQPFSRTNKCSECGIDWSGPMGYVCPSPKCPIQPKIIAASNQETS